MSEFEPNQGPSPADKGNAELPEYGSATSGNKFRKIGAMAVIVIGTLGTSAGFAYETYIDQERDAAACKDLVEANSEATCAKGSEESPLGWAIAAGTIGGVIGLIGSRFVAASVIDPQKTPRL